ncbi:hypothetical protein D3C77_717950 [compost metagenome]
MLGIMTYEFGARAVHGLGRYAGTCAFVLAFAMLQVLQIHPAVVIVLFLGYGAFHMRVVAALRKRKTAEGE